MLRTNMSTVGGEMTKQEAAVFKRQMQNLANFSVDDLFNLRTQLQRYTYARFCTFITYNHLKDKIDKAILDRMEKHDGT